MANARDREPTYDPDQKNDERHAPNRPGKADLASEGYEVLDRAEGTRPREGLTRSTRYSKHHKSNYF